jgi:hypothetical protein
MKKQFQFSTNCIVRCMVLLILLFSFGRVIAQPLTGVKAIPGNYSSVALAIADLNTNGVGVGGVTFAIAAGYSELLTGGLQVTATGTASNPIVFEKVGLGANPIITSFVGTQLASSTTSIDIMWSFVGSDYVTIDGLDLVEAAANTTATTQMEVGYGFYKASGTDGTNNNTVKNCVITLNRNNVTSSSGPRASAGGSVGIEVMACTPLDVSTTITVTTISGASSYNKFYSNTIQNVNFGISLSGYAAPSPYNLADVNNDIGGSTTTTGNTIINFGGGIGAATQCGAVCVRNQWSFNVSNNNINNNDGSGVNHIASNRGIWLHASSVGAGCDINNNKITISAGTSTSAISWCLDVEMAQSGANGNIINIKNNQFLNCVNSAASTAAFTALWLNTAATTVNVTDNYFYGFSYAGTGTTEVILSQLSCGTLNILNNTIDSTTLGGTSGTGTHYNIGITVAVSAVLNINGNTITRTTLNTIGTGTKTIYNIYNSGASPIVNVNNNIIDNLSRNGTTGGASAGIYLSSGTSQTIKNNTVSNFTVNGSGATSTLYGMYVGGTTIVCDSNSVHDLSCAKASGTSLLYGIYDGLSPSNENFNYNTIYNLSHSGTGVVYGMYQTTSTGVRTVSFNKIYAISGGGTVNGLFQTASLPQIFNNRIYDISTTSTSAVVSGISISTASSAGKVQVYNNLISGITAPLSNGGTTSTVRGISLTAITSSVTLGIYHNTIVLSGTSSGTNFSSAGIYHTYSVTATSGSLDFRNNIIVNNVVPTGTGKSSVVWRSAATDLNNFNVSSNNNLLYAGVPSAANLIFYDGTNADQTLVDYKTRVAPREVSSVSEAPNFLSTTGSSSLFLTIDSTLSTQIEANGTIIPNISFDYNNNMRAGYPGYTGTSGLPDLGAIEGNYLGNIANQMVFDSANADQYTGIAIRGATNLNVLRVRVYTQKGYNALQATAFMLTSASTTSTTDISNVKVYYTASDSTFTNPQLFGTATVASSFTVSGSAKLTGGASYFWVTYDIASTATSGNFVDAAVSNITIGGSPVLLINGDPSGNLQIKAPLSGVYNVGAAYSFPTITSALNELAVVGVNGPVTLTLMDASYSVLSGEVFPISLKAYDGMSPINTITIVPNFGVASTIESANTTATLEFNGASNVIIDGRMGSTGVFMLGNNLIISNTASTAPAVRFINDATDNKILYTDLRASNSGAAGTATAGVVNIGTTTGTNGNDNNTVRYCDIHANATGFPAVGVSSIGTGTTASTNNDSNLIIDCNIYDFYVTTVANAAVYVGANNGSWVIKRNHVYQTAKRDYSAPTALVHHGFWVVPNTTNLTTASGFAIDSNYFGGNTANGTGLYEMVGTTAAATGFQFIAIDVSVGKGALTTVQGNTITNFNDSSTSASSISFGAINLSGGKINCNGNMIGSRTVNGAINFTTYSTTVGGCMGIRTGPAIVGGATATTDTINVSNNIISGIDMYGGPTATPEFFGLNIFSGAYINVYNNMIGDTLLPNSIHVLSTSLTSTVLQRVSGIYNNPASATAHTLTNNVIANITNNYAGASALFSLTKGILVVPGAAGTFSVIGNTIKNISTASQTIGTGNNATLIGLSINYTSGTYEISGNKISGLILSGVSTTAPVRTTGVYYNGPTSGNNLIAGNSIHSLVLSAFNPFATINGIELAAGNTIVANNMVSLGFDNFGSSLMEGFTMNGILKNTGSCGIYFNTVYIGGSGVFVTSNRTFAFQRTGAGTDNIRNNIFINARNSSGLGGGHLAIGLNNASTLTQNNNIYRADSIGIFNGTGQQYFTDWQTASTVDVNSKDTTVTFVSYNNLHLAPSMAGVRSFEGVVISGVDDDIDGQTRSIKPYIGADEVASYPLPVELLHVAALVKNEDVLVSWVTASEYNNKGFEVERSLNGKLFKQIGFVQGAGNSNRVSNYEFTDSEAFAKTKHNTLYYRLKQLDMDGSISYSAVIAVSRTNKETMQLNVYPNPTAENFMVSAMAISAGGMEVTILDIQGKVVANYHQETTIGINTIGIEGSLLNTGIYFVKVVMGNESKVVKLVKQ